MDDEGSERSRSRDREDRRSVERRSEDDGGNNHEENHQTFSIYVSNLSIESTDSDLRTAFEPFGAVVQASTVKQPVTKISRGFGFVIMTSADDSQRAIDALNGTELHGKTIRVERARRTVGYEKTPGVYMGPPKLSLKYQDRQRDRSRDRGRDRSRDRSRDRDRHREFDRSRVVDPRRDRSRSRSPDRPRGRYDERDLDRYFRSGGALPLPFDAPPFRDGRYMLDPRLDFRLRYDPRDIRMRDLPIPSYNDRDRMPFDPRRDSRTRSPPPAPYDSRARGDVNDSYYRRQHHF